MGEQAAERRPRWKRWLERMAGTLEIPPEIALDIPKATVIGRQQIQVENHRGLLEYTSRRIRIRTSTGQLVVTGSRLQIGTIFREEIVIDGHIASFEMID